MVDYNPIYTTSESNQSVEYLKEKIQNLEFEIQQLETRKHDEQKEYMKNIEIQKIIKRFVKYLKMKNKKNTGLI